MAAIKGAQSLLTRDQVNMSDGLKSKVAEIEAALLTKGPDQGPKREFEGKPLMEYKMIGDLGKLSNDKSGFRDWKEKTKDALSSIYRDEDLMKILEYIEDPTTKWAGLETLGESYDDAELNGISYEKSKWEKWGRDLKSLVMPKSDEKSEAFLLAKRSGCGWSAWYSLNKWYSAVSGKNCQREWVD